MIEKLKGFDVRDMDAAVRPQDDFFHFAGGGWLKRNKIPENESRWGTFMMLRVEAEKNLKKIVEDLLSSKNPKKGSPEQLVGDLYRSGMDLKTRNALGTKPISPLRERIQAVKDTKGLIALLAYLHRLGIGVPWDAGVDQDSKNSVRYALHLVQGGLGMPDRDYYLKDEPEFLRVRKAYVDHMLRIFGLLGYGKEEALLRAETVMRVETALARVSMNKVDSRDAEKTYHKMSIGELQDHAPQIVWRSFFKDAGVPAVPYVIVMQPQFLKAAAKMLITMPLPAWKVYLEWQVAGDASGFLSDSFAKANFAYAQVLMGAKKMKPLWRRVLSVVNGSLGEPLGKIYVERYFDEKKKHKMDELVSDLFNAYEARIKRLDWMSTATKRKAREKLRLMARKIGYPRKWKSYAGLEIRSNEYFGNVLRIAQFEYKRQMKKLTRKTVDRDEWLMYPQTVNAYFLPNMNEIVFPAAILQPPFFDFNADDAFNYGSIGAVIGHEMTHGFDDQGAKFDGKGNMKDWWTAADKRKFEQKGKMLVAQYNEFVVADGVHVNGKLTLGENMADLGGVLIAFDAYQRHLEKTGRKDIAGFTPEQRFFLGCTLFDRELSRPEFAKMQVLNDPHSPCIFRINGPLAHIDEFYDAWGVEPGDNMYRAPKTRARIW